MSLQQGGSINLNYNSEFSRYHNALLKRYSQGKIRYILRHYVYVSLHWFSCKIESFHSVINALSCALSFVTLSVLSAQLKAPVFTKHGFNVSVTSEMHLYHNT